jgi:hypothetical protein
MMHTFRRGTFPQRADATLDLVKIMRDVPLQYHTYVHEKKRSVLNYSNDPCQGISKKREKSKMGDTD